MAISKVKIISHRKAGQNYWHLAVEAPGIAKTAKPGQFVMIKINDSGGVLLRRPLGVHRVGSPSHKVTTSHVELLYEVVGKGTQALSRKKPGEELDIMGPLGNGFDLSAKRHPLNAILVAGGMGVAPLLFLAEKIVTTSQRHNVTSRLLVLIGGKTKNQIICEKEFKRLGCDVKIATDDGSAGFKGRITTLLKSLLSAKRYPLNAIIYACGPQLMLKEISRLAREYKVPAQVSLEAHMACGIGACLGCAVNIKTGYKRVCKEGPVFNADEIIWEGK